MGCYLPKIPKRGATPAFFVSDSFPSTEAATANHLLFIDKTHSDAAAQHKLIAHEESLLSVGLK